MLKVNEKYSICILCANLFDEVYGDIYDSIEECLKEHPETEVIYGYGIFDNEMKRVADWSDDWYGSIAEAMLDVPV